MLPRHEIGWTKMRENQHGRGPRMPMTFQLRSAWAELLLMQKRMMRIGQQACRLKRSVRQSVKSGLRLTP